MSVRTCEHGKDHNEIPVRVDPLFRQIVQNRNPVEKGEFVILFDNVTCMHEGESVTHLWYTMTVRELMLHVWERA